MTGTLYRGGSLSTGTRAPTALLEAAAASPGSARPSDAPVARRRGVDLGDAWLAPAFVDAHVHVTSTGPGPDRPRPDRLPEPGGGAAPRRGAGQRAGRGGVVLGTGWDETGWPERRPPTARELDRASAGGVVYLARTDVHSAVASSALLAAVPGCCCPARASR